LQALGSKIQKKQIEFAETAELNRRSTIDNREKEDQDQFLKQQFQLSDDELKMAADTEFMSNIIGQRKDDINNIAAIMSDINSIA
jgi:hypothetical protein